MMDSSCTHLQILESITPSVIMKNSSRRLSQAQRNMNLKWFTIQLFTIELITIGWIRSGCHQLTAWFSAYLSFLFSFGYFIISAYTVESWLPLSCFFFLHFSLVLHHFSFSISFLFFLCRSCQVQSNNNKKKNRSLEVSESHTHTQLYAVFSDESNEHIKPLSYKTPTYIIHWHLLPCFTGGSVVTCSFDTWHLPFLPSTCLLNLTGSLKGLCELCFDH